MPFSTIVTPDDLKKGELVEPGWYPCEISNYEEKEAGTDKSCNCIFTFKVLDGPFKGYQGNSLFNEKALGMGKNLWKTLNVPFDPTTGYKLSTSVFEAMKGAKLMVYFKRGTSNKGNPFNDPADFKPLGK